MIYVVITKDSEKHDDIGVPALVREDIPDLVCGYHLAILSPKPSRAAGPYLYYALQDQDVHHQFHSYANGNNTVRASKIGYRTCRDPPVHHWKEQRAIAHVLGTLDDKIELNRRMNRDPGGDCTSHLQGLVRGFRPHPSQDRGAGTLPAAGTVGSVPRPTGGLGSWGDTTYLGIEDNG